MNVSPKRISFLNKMCSKFIHCVNKRGIDWKTLAILFINKKV